MTIVNHDFDVDRYLDELDRSEFLALEHSLIDYDDPLPASPFDLGNRKPLLKGPLTINDEIIF